MKKSERYYGAMMAVLDWDGMNNHEKLEVLETLMNDKYLAELVEKKQEEEK